MKDHRRAGMPSAYPAAIGRRLVTIPAAWLLFAVAIVLAIPALLIAAATDLTLRRRGWPTVRMVAFVVVALWIETTSEVRVLWSWVTQPFVGVTWTERNHRLMRWWVKRLIGAAERVVGVRWRFDVPADLGRGPLLAFSQHVSIVDAVAPVYILANRQGWYLRYTLTRGLRFGPCLDIVGHRIPNHFVARDSGDNTEELAHLRTLVTAMDVDECAAIFPGGGLFTSAGLARAVEKLSERRSPQAVAAAGYRHVLPPRPGGVTAFFDGAPDANVVVVGHVGFEPLASIRRLWSVLPLSEPVDVKIWRYDRAEVPVGEDERMAWLYEKWRIMDDWIDDRLRARGAEGAVDVNYLQVFGASALAIAVLMVGTWVVSLALKNASIVDIVWGAGFVLVAWVSYAVGDGTESRRLLLACMVTLWGGRLAIYLFIRNHGKGEDPRYVAMRKRRGDKFARQSLWVVFGLQGVLMWIVSLPVQVGSVPDQPDSLGPVEIVGIILYTVGVYFESMGDMQLSQFKADPENADKVMDQGLWHYTRHPNYFGDFCVWWGIWIVAAATGIGIYSIVGPIVMTFFLLRVSGVAMLERSIGKRRPGYDDYIRTTNAFFPGPRRL